MIFEKAITLCEKMSPYEKNSSISYLAVSFASHDSYKALKILSNLPDTPSFSLSVLDSMSKYKAIAQITGIIARGNLAHAIAVANKLPTFYKDQAYSLLIANIAGKNRKKAFELASNISKTDYINRYKALIAIAETMNEKNSKKNQIWDTVKFLAENISEPYSPFMEDINDHYIPKYISYCRIALNLSDNDPLKQNLWRAAIDEANNEVDRQSLSFSLQSNYPSQKIDKLLFIYTKIGYDDLHIIESIRKFIKDQSDSVQFSCLSAYVNAERNPSKARHMWDKAKLRLKLIDTTSFDPFLLYSSLNYVPNKKNSTIKTEILEYLLEYIDKNPRLQRKEVLKNTIIDQFEKLKLFRKAYFAIETMGDAEKVVALEKLYTIWNKD
ncbi:MAG TPA: hypothetical protein VGI43_14055 [Mucilaginibacter sp.]